MLRHTQLLKRAVEAGVNYDGASSGPGNGDNDGSTASPIEMIPVLIFLANFIIFFPIWMMTNYTFSNVFPVLAMVEDEKPPAYEPVSLNADDAASLPEEPTLVPGTKKPASRQDSSKAISSSFRGLNRLLRADLGFRSYMKGLACWFFMHIVSGLLLTIFASALHPFLAPLATLLATLTVIQFSTAWVHIVITPFSGWSFWRRLPSFRRAFNATWRPVVLLWVANEVSVLITEITAWTLGMDVFAAYKGEPVSIDGILWKGPVVFIIAFVTAILITVPAHVILVRVQASLLPAGEDTIVPFDRSFEGKIEPAVIGGKGYATISDAWSTFSGAAWRRLCKLYVKVFAVNALISAAIAAIVCAQFAATGVVGSSNSRN